LVLPLSLEASSHGVEPGFGELLGRTREAALAAQAHQDVPFEKLVEELAVERSLSHSPLFQVLFVFQNAPETAVEIAGLELHPLPSPQGGAKFDLTLNLSGESGRLAGQLEYNTDLFDRTTVLRLAGHLGQLLAAIAEEPTLRFSALPLLSAAEALQVSVEWNDTAMAYPAAQTLTALLAAQAERAPDSIVLSFGGEELSYRELDARSNRLARHLVGLGVGPEVVVAVCLERSFEMVTALLAVLKAGGAYLPIDPDYPAERQGLMLADSGAPLLIGSRHLLARLPVGGVRAVDLEAEAEVIGRESAGPLADRAEPDNVAYVIYTSGSTGRPKGVMNSHRGICNRLHWMQAAYRLGGADRVLQKTPTSFDVSVWELFWPLTVGARLVLAAPGGHREPSYLWRLIDEEKVTVLHFVPSMLQPFLETADEGDGGSLRFVICSGEALGTELERRFFAHFVDDGPSLENLYGPTEAAVDVTAWRCSSGQPSRATVPIGRPIGNTAIHLLDPDLRPVPVGVSGELHIGGVQVARGYLGRPELTAERFIPDPFAACGARLYR
ncbi:MAG TPA: amino acid adenylation domain-containing protein, partial [Thermoanaerobaculia bacterium]|nr:amino acid adenylation domain-containing protein [Thermoanaerobaculia bacterium]